MSFRELREATEMLRALGFPRLVSIENFRYPNFPLMAEVLEWTVRKFDPNVRFPKQLDREQDRVIFVKSAVLTLLQKAHIWLNPKNIYQSDGHAIHELHPVLKMLHESVKERRQKGQQKGGGGGEDSSSSPQITAIRAEVNGKRKEVRQTIQLAAELPKSGANLYELLRDEIFAKEVRAKALGHSLNGAQIEKEIRERIQTTEQQIGEFKQRLDNIGDGEQELAKKIERRRREMDQLQKRLAKLQSFRPPYMDECERYEQELKEKYAMYVTLFRNLHYLQQLLAQAEQAERDQAVNAEQSMRIAVEKMRVESEQQAAMMPSSLAAGIQIGDGDENERENQSNEIRVFGNMTGAGLSDEDEDEEEDGEDGGRIIEVDDEEEEEDEDHIKMDDEKFGAGHSDEEEERSANDF